MWPTRQAESQPERSFEDIKAEIRQRVLHETPAAFRARVAGELNFSSEEFENIGFAEINERLDTLGITEESSFEQERAVNERESEL